METLADRLKKSRLKKKLSPEKIARRMKIATELYCDWENGKSEPDTPSANRLALILGVTSDYIIFGNDNTSGLHTMFPANASPEKIGRGGFCYIIGTVLTFCGGGGFATIGFMMLTRYYNSGYSSYGEYLRKAGLGIPILIFILMILTGAVLCIIGSAFKRKQKKEHTTDEKKN